MRIYWGFDAEMRIKCRFNEDLMRIERRKRLGVNSDTFFFIPSEENRIIEQQGTVNNRTFVLLNFRSIILFPLIFPTFTR